MLQLDAQESWERTARRNRPSKQSDRNGALARGLFRVLVPELPFVPVRVTIELSCNGMAVALNDLVDVVGLLAEDVATAWRTVAD